MKRVFPALFTVALLAAVLALHLTGCGSETAGRSGENVEVETEEAERTPAFCPSEKTPVTSSLTTEREHIHSFGEWTVVKQASCTKDGLKKRTCACGVTETEVVPAAGHTVVTDEAIEPTCSDRGMTEGSHCSVCGKVISAQKSVPRKDHVVVTDAAIEPTCTENGLTEGSHCSVCGKVLTAQRSVPKKDHAAVIDEAVEPTCTEAGLTEGSHCSVCGKVLKAQRSVPKKGHVIVVDAAIEPTCTKAGLTEGSHCSVCGEVIKAQEEIQARGHNYQNGVCLSCGERLASEGLEFSLSEDGAAYILTGVGSCAEKHLIIPDVHLGKPVRAIGSRAFEDQTQIRSVTVPDGITAVGDVAFSGCTNLESLTLPRSLASFGERSLFRCDKLTRLLFYGGQDAFQKLFSGRENETPEAVFCVRPAEQEQISWSFVKGVLTISGGGRMNDYAGYPELRPWKECAQTATAIVISEGITYVGSSAFENFTALKEVRFADPSSLDGIGRFAFYNCGRLKTSNATIDKENAPQLWLNNLIADNGRTYKKAHRNEPFLCDRGDGSEPCCWECWQAHGDPSDMFFHMTYQLDLNEFDASFDYKNEISPYTWEIWFKDDDVDESYAMIRTKPISLFTWKTGSAVFRIPTFGHGMTDLHTNGGEANLYDFIFVVYDDRSGRMLGWARDRLKVTDSYEAYLKEATENNYGMRWDE